MNQDIEHLRLLAIFHYIMGALMGCFSCFPLLYVVMGLLFIAPPAGMQGQQGQPPPALVGWFMVAFGSGLALLGWAFATCLVLAGRSLSTRRHYTFCLVVAALACLQIPIGTVLGIFTFIVLLRPTVKPLFEGRAGPPLDADAPRFSPE